MDGGIVAGVALGAFAVAAVALIVARLRRSDVDGRRHPGTGPARMHAMDGAEFEELCADHFEDLGYTVDFTPASGDGGIDLVLTRDGELRLVQCKRTGKPVGQPVVRDLYGAMHHAGADGVVLCASAGFTPAAREWALGKQIELLDGETMLLGMRGRRPRRGGPRRR